MDTEELVVIPIAPSWYAYYYQDHGVKLGIGLCWVQLVLTRSRQRSLTIAVAKEELKCLC